MGVDISLVISLVLVSSLNNYVITVNAIDCRRECVGQRNYLAQFTFSQVYLNNVYFICMKDCINTHGAQTTPPTIWTPPTTTTRRTTRFPITTNPNPTWIPGGSTPRPVQYDCGYKQLFLNKVIGGVPVTPCEFPWMVNVQTPNFFCGGAIIDKRHVITAAHCLKHPTTRVVVTPNQVAVKIGSSRRSQLRIVNVARVYVNPKHNTYRDYDIAVLTLAQDLVYDQCVSPVCLPSTNQRAEDMTECIVTGWGLVDTMSRYQPDVLQKVTVPIVDRSKCMSSYGGLYFNDLKLCAGDFEFGKTDSCQGDSGGPLMCRVRNGPFTIFGVVSFGNKCALPRYPGVYTNINHPLIMQYILQAISDVRG